MIDEQALSAAWDALLQRHDTILLNPAGIIANKAQLADTITAYLAALPNDEGAFTAALEEYGRACWGEHEQKRTYQPELASCGHIAAQDIIDHATEMRETAERAVLSLYRQAKGEKP